MKLKEFKRATIISILSLVVVAFISSCSNDNQENFPSQESKDLEVSELKNLLIEVNGITESQITNNGYTIRAPWWKYLVMAAADAAGALLPGGNVATGIAASSLAWTVMKDDDKAKQTNESSETPSIFLKGEQPYHFPKGSAGYIHNEVIERAYLSNGKESFFKLAEEKQVEILWKHTEEVIRETGSSLEISDLNVKAALEISKKVSGALVPGMTVVEYASALKQVIPDETFQYSVDIIASAVSGLENSASNEDEYVGRITKAIEDSSIDEKLKAKLSDAVSIAFASSILWNTTPIRN